MIRARRIPPLLNRVLGDGITTALLLTGDGELLGSATLEGENISEVKLDTPSLGALVAEVARDYIRAGTDLLTQNQPIVTSNSNISSPSSSGTKKTAGGGNNNQDGLQCLLLELEDQLIGLSMCTTSNNRTWYVVAVGNSREVEMGLMRTRLTALQGYICEAMQGIGNMGGDNAGSMQGGVGAVATAGVK
uniref:Roadblock/LAMTOR2 domain-containing protein n=1 Tax=Leptocylindrus danicus TaxID=163516 RepID=A0A7S2P5S0_9STRA